MLYTAGLFERGYDHDGGEMKVDGVWIPGFKAGTFFWNPAPAVFIIVIEDLRQAIQKLNQSVHVLGVTILLWRKCRRHI